MTLGQRMRELRTEKSLLQREMSEACGISNTYLSDLENDRQNPSLNTLVRVAGALRVSVADLVTGCDDMGEVTAQALPRGLRDLLEDPAWSTELDDEWVRVLAGIKHQGRRLQTKEGCLLVFLTLRLMFRER